VSELVRKSLCTIVVSINAHEARDTFPEAVLMRYNPSVPEAFEFSGGGLPGT
jgi:hypothetical protein